MPAGQASDKPRGEETAGRHGYNCAARGSYGDLRGVVHSAASQISAEGMTLARKHGIGFISIESLLDEGLNALPTQWGFAEAAAAKPGKTVDRKRRV
jgi:hypothetical protein